MIGTNKQNNTERCRLKPLKLCDVRNGLLLALAYIVGGKLSLILAVPPGYASPIFPLAGIAVAAVYICGSRALPWILLGSALLDLWIGYSPENPFSATSLTAAALIALASMLQAAIGGWALRRFIGYPSPFDTVRDVSLVLFLSPTICLVSSSLSVIGLTALNTLEVEAFASNWFTWWIGDTLGVIVLLPIVLTFVGEPRSLWRRRILTVAVPMLLAFCIVVFVFVQTSKWEHEEAMVEFQSRSQQLADTIEAKFGEQESLLKEVVGFLSHDLTKPVTREEFRRVLQKSLKRSPMVHAVGWAPRIEDAQRASFEADQQRSLPGFQIRELDTTGQLKPAGRRAYYYPVTYVEPNITNKTAVGLDLVASTERRDALSATMALGVPVATSPLRLGQEDTQQAGILLMLKVSEGGNAPGVALTVLRSGDFLDGFLPQDRSSFHLQLTDQATQQRVYGELDESGPRTMFAQSLTFGTRQYLLQIQPTLAYLKQHRGRQSWTVLVVELLGTGLLGAFLLLGTGYTARVEAQVIERTDSLAASRDDLNEAQRLAKMGSWVLDLQKDHLTWSDEIFRIFEIDPQMFSPSYELFLNAIHPEDRERVDRVYRESVANHTPYDIVHRLLLNNGRIKYVREHGETHYDEKGVPVLSHGTVQDITKIREAEEALHQSEERWKFALEGAGDGVWDWNIQTGELYLSKQEMTVLGYDGEPATYTHIDDWLERQHPEDREKRLSALDNYLAGKASLYVCEFRTRARDGSWKWVLARGMLLSRTTDGKPLRMIGTHSDITERKEMEAELRRLATTDSLTGVANRRRFIEQLDKELARIKRFNLPASLLMVDIDYFKRVNDTYGHAAGDAVLKHLTASAEHHLRSIDLFGRIGGEEFAVLLPGTDKEGAREFAEQLRSYVAETPAKIEAGEVHVTISIGVTQFKPTDLIPDAIFARADEALYRAKQAGRNRVEVN